jgi:geranylgeranyl reductase family protein
MARVVDVAVVGAGPAGATLARRLAEGGAKVVLFDHTHPREKVCGGGISARARAMFPELERLAPLGRSGTSLRLVAPDGLTATVAGRGETFAIDRAIFDRALLDEAVAAGAAWRAEKVLAATRVRGGFVLETRAASCRARLLVGADGARSSIRRGLVGPIPNEHLGFGAHALAPRLDPPSAMLRFFGDRRGYAWVFNRREQSSVGVGMPLTHKNDWRSQLERHFRREAPERALRGIRAWVLPQAAAGEFFRAPIAGDDWLLVGDAAGHCDPLTGEGIVYALWGARLAAEAILRQRPASFDAAWRNAYLARFERHLKLAPTLANRFLLDALIAAGRLPFVGARLFGMIGGN